MLFAINASYLVFIVTYHSGLESVSTVLVGSNLTSGFNAGCFSYGESGM